MSAPAGRVLIVEDDAAMCASLRALVASLELEVRTAPSAELALDEARAALPDVVLLDLHLPGRSGQELLPELLRLDPAPAVVMMTAQPTAENAIDAMAEGAAAHLAKPLEFEELEEVLQRLLQGRARADVGAGEPAAPALVGRSPAMLELGRRIGALARSGATVLIRGESGTGKELAARAIHERSPRRAGPFLAVSCATLPESLVEAELFGHARGAFTGAQRAHPGRVERAEGGTLFLDEVGELSLPAQAKLLRFLEERVFERVGEGTPRRADVRVLAATNAPLEERLEEGSFREDLYYRLNVTYVELPPLRRRLEDVPLLVDHFLARLGRSEVRLEPAAYAQLLARPWPGNVRELRNAVESALVALGEGTLLRAEQFAVAASPARPAAAPDALARVVQAIVRSAHATPAGAAEEGEGLYARVRAQVERELVATALELSVGNQVAAARLLGMNRATLRRKMADYGLG